MKSTEKKEKKVRYPANLILKKAITASGYKVGFLADKLKVSREFLGKTINGHRKSTRLVRELFKILGL